MLETLEIENFRCFESLKIEGLKRINLIGGMNNSGKTALLEAIYLMLEKDIIRLLRGRRITDEQIALREKLFYSHFFNGEDTSKEIKLEGKVKGFELPAGSRAVVNRNPHESNKKSLSFISLKEDFFRRSQPIRHLTLDLPVYYYSSSSSSIETKAFRNPVRINREDNFPEIKATLLLPHERKKDIEMANDFDQTLLEGVSDLVLEIMQKVDPNVLEVRTLSLGIPKIYLKKSDGQMHQLNLFGDAVNRVMEMVLTIINKKNSVLLIDEIENGIHYTRQAEFWRLLNQLAETFNVQIFATTHSKEMLNAFSQTFCEENDAIYIEMARHAKTNKISAINHRLELLEHELEQDLEIRGE